jgi:GAF domain-containing protein
MSADGSVQTMSREELLVGTLVELADSLVEDFDVIDVLTVLSDRCVEVLDVDSAGVMLVAPSGALQLVASSSETMRDLELFELQANEGPCVDCFVSGIPVTDLELSEVGEHWPRFAQRAMNEGFHSVLALPMHVRERTVGALNMFRTGNGPLPADDVHAAQALADVATIAIVQHQSLLDASTLNSQLNEALNSRIIVEQAKGKVSEAANLDMDCSFQRLRNHARRHNMRLTDLSRHIAEGTKSVSSLDPLPPSRRPK